MTKTVKMLWFVYMAKLTCAQQDLSCDFHVETDSAAETVSKYIAHCLEAHQEFLGELRETMSEDEIRAMLLEQVQTT